MVILAPAAVDVVSRLGAGDSVVGVTNSVAEFPQARRVGIHLNPGIEQIAALRPTLIIAASRFDPSIAERLGAEFFLYEPKTLDQIIELVQSLAAKLGRPADGAALAAELRAALDSLRPPAHSPTVLYEVTAGPLLLAKDNSIVRDVLERAGMRYAYPRTTGGTSAEYLMANQPELYIYQVGPMNKAPAPPLQRPGWGAFNACIWRVDEFEFARPNTRLFERVKELNAILNSDNPCAAGMALYPVL